MAVYFVNQNKKEEYLHVGQPLTMKPEEVVEVQADGDELERIRDIFGTVPPLNKRVVKFFGEDAKFIARSW